VDLEGRILSKCRQGFVAALACWRARRDGDEVGAHAMSSNTGKIKIDSAVCMSARNGDKARFGRLRKQKIARRVRNRELRKLLTNQFAVDPLRTLQR
jgi:hypothetical protein